MKHLLFIITILFSVTSFAQNWQLVWQDEFNGSGLPDATKWGYDTGNNGWGNYELQNYTANRTENARQENGNLIIEARRDWYNGIEYSSARLVSKNKGDWKYGRIEVKAKIPLGKGLWPAIWMLPTDWVYGGWPASGEIDIMENFALGGIKPNSIEGNVHTQAYNHSIGTNKGAKKDGLSNIQDNYHVYAVNWFEDKIEFQVDGQTYFTFLNEGNWQAWPFDQRFHLIMNIAVGGSLGTTPDPTIFPKRMEIDYVRVYTESNSPIASTGLITAYNDCNYQGFSGGFDEVGDYTLADLQSIGLTTNTISSISIPKGYKVEIFDEDNFQGNSITLIESSSCLANWNDRVASLKIIPNGTSGLDGLVYFQNRNSSKYMDLENNGDIANGANYLQWEGTGAENQQFNITDLGNGVYSIFNEKTKKSLDIAEISKANGANLQQWEYNATESHRQFIIIETNDGFHQLIALHSGKVIEVENGSFTNGANVHQNEYSTAHQAQWKIQYVNITGLRETASNNKIFVGANGQQLMVNDAALQGTAIYIYNSHGQMVLENRVRNNKIDISQLTPGIYFCCAPMQPQLKMKFIKK